MLALKKRNQNQNFLRVPETVAAASVRSRGTSGTELHSGPFLTGQSGKGTLASMGKNLIATTLMEEHT